MYIAASMRTATSETESNLSRLHAGALFPPLGLGPRPEPET